MHSKLESRHMDKLQSVFMVLTFPQPLGMSQSVEIFHYRKTYLFTPTFLKSHHFALFYYFLFIILV